MQNWVGRITPTRLLTPAIRAISPPALVRWAFGNYRDICPPEYILQGDHGAAPGSGERTTTAGATAAA